MKLLTMFMAALAIGGAAFTTSLSPEFRALGFTIWIVSNAYLMREFYIRKEYEWVVVYVIYEALNVVGVINNYKAM